MKKIIFLVLVAVLLVCASAGCIDKEYTPDYKVKIYVDEETGVEYIMVFVGSICEGIAPRYNTDGTLKINEEFKR